MNGARSSFFLVRFFFFYGRVLRFGAERGVALQFGNSVKKNSVKKKKLVLKLAETKVPKKWDDPLPVVDENHKKKNSVQLGKFQFHRRKLA